MILFRRIGSEWMRRTTSRFSIKVNVDQIECRDDGSVTVKEMEKEKTGGK